MEFDEPSQMFIAVEGLRNSGSPCQVLPPDEIESVLLLSAELTGLLLCAFFAFVLMLADAGPLPAGAIGLAP